LQFTGVQEGDYNGDGVSDSLLHYASGDVLVLGVTGLTLADWNSELVI
jgi:hypothetical protein